MKFRIIGGIVVIIFVVVIALFINHNGEKQSDFIEPTQQQSDFKF